MKKVVNIDRLFEARSPEELKGFLREGLFTHLLTGIVGYILGKETGIKIAGTQRNVDAFERALANIKQDMRDKVWSNVNIEEPEIKKLMRKYDIKITKKNKRGEE